MAFVLPGTSNHGIDCPGAGSRARRSGPPLSKTTRAGEGDSAMRKSGVIALAVIGLLFLGGAVLYYSKYRQSQAEFAQMTAQEHETRIKYGQAINEIAMIQDSLNTIVLGEAPLLRGHAQSEVPLPPTVRDQVLGRIATLRAGLERTKERIQTLDAKLKRNGVQISGLQKMIAGLKKNVVEREESIAQLN